MMVQANWVKLYTGQTKNPDIDVPDIAFHPFTLKLVSLQGEADQSDNKPT